jgi:hypothetical protein
MGNCSSAFDNVQKPNPKDPSLSKCSDSIGDLIDIGDTHICYSRSSLGTKGDEYIITDFCRSIGDGTEWVGDLDQGSFSCCQSSGNSFEGIALTDDRSECHGLCKGDSATWTGTKGVCKRVSFSADPVVCCFLDNDCNPTGNTQDAGERSNACFQTNIKDKTCDPRYRNMTSQSCLDKIKPFCTGEQLFEDQDNWWDLWVEDTTVDVNSDEISRVDPVVSQFTPQNFKQPTKQQIKRNMKQPCMRALARAITKDDQFCTWDSIKNTQYRRGDFNTEGLSWAQEVVETIFNRYINEFGSFVGGVDRDGKQIDSIENVFLEICTKFPILCQSSLTRLCENISSEDIATTPRADIWCGCYMGETEYQKYTDLFQINRECTPFCNTDESIPLVDSDGYQIECLTDICIIDDLKLDFIRNRTLGNNNEANFTQVCGGCGNSNVSTDIGEQGDFNTGRDTIVGLFTENIFDDFICRTISVSSPYGDLFKLGTQVTVVATGENNNKINVTVRQDQRPQGNDSLTVWSIHFVSATPINTSWMFKNGEELTFDGYTLPCKIYAITVDVNGSVVGDKTTKNMHRTHEAVANQCTCILEGSTIEAIDSEFGNINLTQNCGSNHCTDKEGKQIPCMNSSVQDDVDYFSKVQALNDQQKNIKTEKINAIAIIILGILILFFVIYLGIGISTSFRKTKKEQKVDL